MGLSLKKLVKAGLSPVSTVTDALGTSGGKVGQVTTRLEGKHEALAAKPLYDLGVMRQDQVTQLPGQSAQAPQQSWRDQRMGIDYGSINPRTSLYNPQLYTQQQTAPMSVMLSPNRMDQAWANLEALKIRQQPTPLPLQYGQTAMNMYRANNPVASPQRFGSFFGMGGMNMMPDNQYQAIRDRRFSLGDLFRRNFGGIFRNQPPDNFGDDYVDGGF